MYFLLCDVNKLYFLYYNLSVLKLKRINISKIKEKLYVNDFAFKMLAEYNIRAIHKMYYVVFEFSFRKVSFEVSTAYFLSTL
jgi:hypothetical protein